MLNCLPPVRFRSLGKLILLKQFYMPFPICICPKANFSFTICVPVQAPIISAPLHHCSPAGQIPS